MTIKQSIASLAVSSLLLGTLAAPVLAQNAPQGGSNPPAQGQQQRHERHPHIRRALHMLQKVKEVLEHEKGGGGAAADFGGNRVKAIEDINRAIQDLQAALQSDKH